MNTCVHVPKYGAYTSIMYSTVLLLRVFTLQIYVLRALFTWCTHTPTDVHSLLCCLFCPFIREMLRKAEEADKIVRTKFDANRDGIELLAKPDSEIYKVFRSLLTVQVLYNCILLRNRVRKREL